MACHGYIRPDFERLIPERNVLPINVQIPTKETAQESNNKEIPISRTPFELGDDSWNPRHIFCRVLAS